jgi:hypothetical protein
MSLRIRPNSRTANAAELTRLVLETVIYRLNHTRRWTRITPLKPVENRPKRAVQHFGYLSV